MVRMFNVARGPADGGPAPPRYPDERAREHVRGIVDTGMDSGVPDQRRQSPQWRREHRLRVGGTGDEGKSGGGMAGGEGARERHLDVASRELLGLLPRGAPPGGQRLGDEVGKAGGDAERDEALPSRMPAAGPAKDCQRGRDREPELAVVSGAGETAHCDVQRGGLAGSDRPIEGAVDCLRLAEPLVHRDDDPERFGVPRPAIRASARAVSQAPSGISADGEAPGCAAAIRTRSAAGRILKRSGASRVTASPSMPAAIGPSASTSNAGVDHSRQGRWNRRRPATGEEATVIPSSASSILGRVPEPTARPRR